MRFLRLLLTLSLVAASWPGAARAQVRAVSLAPTAGPYVPGYVPGASAQPLGVALDGFLREDIEHSLGGLLDLAAADAGAVGLERRQAAEALLSLAKDPSQLEQVGAGLDPELGDALLHLTRAARRSLGAQDGDKARRKRLAALSKRLGRFENETFSTLSAAEKSARLHELYQGQAAHDAVVAPDGASPEARASAAAPEASARAAQRAVPLPLESKGEAAARWAAFTLIPAAAVVAADAALSAFVPGFGANPTASLWALTAMAGLYVPAMAVSRVELARAPGPEANPYRKAFDVFFGLSLGGLLTAAAQSIAAPAVEQVLIPGGTLIATVAMVAGVFFAISARTAGHAMRERRAPTLGLSMPTYFKLFFFLWAVYQPWTVFGLLLGSPSALIPSLVLALKGMALFLILFLLPSRIERIVKKAELPAWRRPVLAAAAPAAKGRRFKADPVRNRLARSLAWIAAAMILSYGLTMFLTGGAPFNPLDRIGPSILFLAGFWLLSGLVSRLFLRAKRVREGELYDIVKELAADLKMPMPVVAVAPAKAPNAWASGPFKGFATVGATQGLLDTMSRDQVKAVLAHEMSHVRYWHIGMTVLLIGALQIMPTTLGDGAGFLQLLAMNLALPAFMFLLTGLSRSNEYMADEGGAKAAGKDAMISGLRTLVEKNPPGKRGLIVDSFASHPSIDDRVERLSRIDE